VRPFTRAVALFLPEVGLLAAGIVLISTGHRVLGLGIIAALALTALLLILVVLHTGRKR
jgi:hypothetical protein